MEIRSIYIHIPFCRKKCLYCDFYSITDLKLLDEYLAKLVLEIKNSPFKNQKIQTLYIGGGTPSLLCEKFLKKIFDAVYSHFNLTKNCEITVEANPESLTKSFLKAAKNCGINRLSLGFQSLNNSLLKKIGRIHTQQTAKKSFFLARETGFKNINIDIIYGFEGRNFLKNTLEEILKLSPEHVSAYIYTPKNNSRLKTASEKNTLKLYKLVCKTLGKFYYHYEISNFSKDGFYSKHNLNYWLGKNYLGFGAGAIGTVDFLRIKNPKLPTYLKSPFRKEIEVLSPRQKKFEKKFLLLRTKKGIRFEKKHIPFIEKGWMKKKGKTTVFTEEGWFISNSILSEII